MHAKRPRYCSSELKSTWTVQTQRKQMHAKGEENRPGDEGRWRSCNNIESVVVAWSLFVCFKPFSFCSVFVSISCFFLPLCLRHSLDWFLHFLLPCSEDFICKNKWSKDLKSVPAPTLFLLSFFHLLFSLLSLLLPAFLIS